MNNNRVLVFCVLLILVISSIILFCFKNKLCRETYEEDNYKFKYYKGLLKATDNMNYSLSNQRLTLRVSENNSNKDNNSNEQDDVVKLPEEAVKVYNYVLDKICNNRIIFSDTMSRNYYNKSIGPQLYWQVIQSNDNNRDDILVSLGLIELTIFEGHKIVYKDDGIVEISDKVKDILQANNTILTQDELKILLLNYVNNLFNEEYILQNYLKNENLTELQIRGIKQVISSSVKMIKEDSKNLCIRLSNYNDTYKRNMLSLSERFKNANKFLKTYVAVMQQENKNILDFGMENNIFLNNLLNNFKPLMKQENLKQISFPMTELDFNKLRIIPLYILLSTSLSDQEKKYFSALFAMIHYSVKTKNFSNINNFLNKMPIIINDQVKKVIKADKNEFTYDETLNIFYNYYKIVFQELMTVK